MSEVVLDVRDVWKQFGDTPVLEGVDLTVARHEVVVLIGASGSGKSTLLKTINLLEQIDDGVIEFEGDDITDPRTDANAVRGKIGTVFQHYNLFPHLTVLANVSLALRKVHKVPRAEANERALAMLDRVQLADKAREFPDRLSGGQQQRVAIARAMVTEPRLLLLDEITSALDPMLVGEVLRVVLELKAGGSTIVMATHEMDFARRAADRVVFLKGGRIIESGTPEQIFENPQHPDTIEFLARVRERP